jgi:hypothetical protein
MVLYLLTLPRLCGSVHTLASPLPQDAAVPLQHVKAASGIFLRKFHGLIAAKADFGETVSGS